MNASRILLIAALVCAVIGTLLGFDLVTTDDPHLLGWVSATLALYLGSRLA